ncbi:MAG: argininosuccinate lyase [Azospirillaceae bacterium]
MARDPATSDDTRFPSAVYRDTVLAPLFETTKREFAAGLYAINEAHGVMLAETGILGKADVGRILAAHDRIVAETDLSALVYDGTVEDLFFHVERELKRRLGAELGGRLHVGRSRNDMDHTLFKMRLKEKTDGLWQALGRLIARLLDKAEAEAGTVIVAFTPGQPAQPTTFGHFLAAVAEMLLRDGERLAAAQDGLDECPMGAAAITTTGFPIDRERVADLLGFARVKENAYGCIAAIDYAMAVYAALKILFIDIGRVVQELGHWTQFETRQLYVPNDLVQISSIMPQKRNPVPVEHMRLMASMGAGRADAFVDTMRNTPFMDMNDGEGEVQAAGFAAFDTADRLIALFAAFLEGVAVDDDAVADLVDRSCITLTELADSLVREEGLAFREGHEIAAAVSRAVTAAGGRLSALGYDAFARVFAETTGRQPGIDAEAFLRFVSADHFIAVRDRRGGPAPAALAASLAGYRETLAVLDHRWAGYRQRAAEAATRRRGAVAALIDAAGTTSSAAG